MTTPLAAATQPTTTAAPAEEEADATTTTAPADDGGGEIDQAATVALGETALGDALVDESGLTLYVFTNDTTRARASARKAARRRGRR